MIKDRQDGMLIQPKPDDTITPVDQTTLAPNALKDDQTEPKVLLESNTNANSLTNDDVHNAVEIEAEKMIYTFLGVMFGAILVGALIGSICIFTCLKCYRRNQSKRLSKAQQSNHLVFQTDAGQTEQDGASTQAKAPAPATATEAPMGMVPET